MKSGIWPCGGAGFQFSPHEESREDETKTHKKESACQGAGKEEPYAAVGAAGRGVKDNRQGNRKDKGGGLTRWCQKDNNEAHIGEQLEEEDMSSQGWGDQGSYAKFELCHPVHPEL